MLSLLDWIGLIHGKRKLDKAAFGKRRWIGSAWVALNVVMSRNACLDMLVS